MEQEQLQTIEDFVQKLQSKINFLKDHLSLLNLDDPVKKKLTEETIAMLESKVQSMIDAKNKKELKKVLRVKKLLEDRGHE